MFTLFGITFHYYGLIVSLGVIVGLLLVEKKAQEKQIPAHFVWQYTLIGLVGGIVGARLYHLVTDFHLYRHNLWEMFKVWHGGLGILGGVIGGLGAIVWYKKYIEKETKGIPLMTVLDLAVFGLPFSQAIGRWGNFVNQELYGRPSNLPWAITIEMNKRVVGFEQYDRFHPLFLYESILLFLFGLLVWRFCKNLGTGQVFFTYVVYYCVVRFVLEFLRIEGTMVLSYLSLNQLVVMVIICAVVFWWKFRLKK